MILDISNTETLQDPLRISLHLHTHCHFHMHPPCEPGNHSLLVRKQYCGVSHGIAPTHLSCTPVSLHTFAPCMQAAGKQLSATCSAGAREALTRLTAASAHAGSRTGKVRFKQGSVDEISFLGAELGPLASLLVGPEHGSWFVEEITVLSSRTTHQDR